MHRVSVRKHFDAAHYLTSYKGKCEQLHGHRFQVAVTLEAMGLNEFGMVYDFSELKAQLGNILDKLDHVCLNEVEPFDRITPSSENIAVFVYGELEKIIKAPGVSIFSVEVWESPDSRATYLP